MRSVATNIQIGNRSTNINEYITQKHGPKGLKEGPNDRFVINVKYPASNGGSGTNQQTTASARYFTPYLKKDYIKAESSSLE